MHDFDFGQLAHVAGPPEASALFKSVPEDFQVTEDLGFSPDGEGQHQLLRVRKREANTEWVAQGLAAFAGVSRAQVSFAGLKDRWALAEQWFSIDLAGRAEPDWSTLELPGVEVLEVARHRRKLRRGTLAGNRFALRLRQVSGDRPALEGRLARLAEQGAPNYFGPQRFGRGGDNLRGAESLFAGRRIRDRHRRGLYLSAARSALFNAVCSARVAAGTWCTILPGDVLSLTGSRSFFLARPDDPDLASRLAAGDVSPSGPLWGAGELPSRDATADLERRVLEPFAGWCRGLEAAGLRQERRALRVQPAALSWTWEGDDLWLRFGLPAGCYATAVVRELVQIPELAAAEQHV